MKKLLIKIPTRARGLDWLQKWLDNSTFAEFLISLDDDEYTKDDLPKIKRVTFVIGKSESKVHAINRDIDKFVSKYECLAVFGDDFEPTANFDKAIFDAFTYHKELTFYNTDFCLHFSDGFTHERLCTYPVLGQEYYKRFGYVYNPQYRSEWCDNEQTDVAKILNRYVYIDSAVCVHRHYVNDRTVKKDALYDSNEKLATGDRFIYNERKKVNFDVKPDYKPLSLVL